MHLSCYLGIYAWQTCATLSNRYLKKEKKKYVPMTASESCCKRTEASLRKCSIFCTILGNLVCKNPKRSEIFKPACLSKSHVKPRRNLLSILIFHENTNRVLHAWIRKLHDCAIISCTVGVYWWIIFPFWKSWHYLDYFVLKSVLGRFKEQ